MPLKCVDGWLDAIPCSPFIEMFFFLSVLKRKQLLLYLSLLEKETFVGSQSNPRHGNSEVSQWTPRSIHASKSIEDFSFGFLLMNTSRGSIKDSLDYYYISQPRKICSLQKVQKHII